MESGHENVCCSFSSAFILFISFPARVLHYVKYADEDGTKLEMKWPEDDAFILKDSEAVE